jgi:hypothetical protein
MRHRHLAATIVILASGLAVWAGCGGSPPVAPTPARFDPTLDDIARTCALMASCADAHDPTHLRSPSACTDYWLTNLRAERSVLECLLLAKTCVAAERCTHPQSDVGAAAFCEAHPGTLGTCDGNLLISCVEPADESVVVDCGTLAGKCTEQPVSGGLLVRGCLSPTLCPEGAPESRCEGDGYVVRCESGLAERDACPAGTRCVERVEAGERRASCEAVATADHPRRCNRPGLATCEGDRATFCTLVGQSAWLRTVDCAARGMTCGMRAGRAVCVVRGQPECAPGPSWCEGDAVVFCAAGHRARVPCASLGMARCEPGARGFEAACR